MQIKVRLFARHRQIVGARDVALELPDGATVADAWSTLVALHPELAPATNSVRFALNGTYAERSEALSEGDEIACIPPVAGGAGGGREAAAGARSTAAAAQSISGRHREVAFTPHPIDDALLARLRHAVATPADGAVVTFMGQTRETPGSPAPGEEAVAARHVGQLVRSLEYEAYEQMALTVLESIAGEIEGRFRVSRLAIVHRTGTVPVGESSVAIVVAAPHRGEAFDACRYAIEELKARAPIWKSEAFQDGSVWLGAPARSGPADQEA